MMIATSRLQRGFPPLSVCGSVARAFFFMVLSCGTCVSSGRVTAPNPSQEPEPGSSQAFRVFLSRLVDAAPKKSEKDFAAIAGDIQIPDYRAWFSRNFGEQEGQKLSDRYERSLPGLIGRLRQDLNFASSSRAIEFKVERWEKDKEGLAQGLDRDVLAALKEPVSYFKVSIVFSSGNIWPVAAFFHVDGAFRYLPYDVFHALGNSSVRMRVGGNIQQARLISQVAPVYPPLARAAGISGTVTLQAIIAKDGSVVQIEVMTGHPLLIQEALDAVRQWRYQPTLFNNEPVEVVTRIDVVFSLSTSPPRK